MQCSMDVDSVAGELYGLPPEEFVRARTGREKQARAAGDRDLAAQIHALAKPTAVAWLANQLVREHGDEIAPLLDIDPIDPGDIVSGNDVLVMVAPGEHDECRESAETPEDNHPPDVPDQGKSHDSREERADKSCR